MLTGTLHWFHNYTLSWFLKDCFTILFSIYCWYDSVPLSCACYSPNCSSLSSNFDRCDTAVNPWGWKLQWNESQLSLAVSCWAMRAPTPLVNLASQSRRAILGMLLKRRPGEWAKMSWVTVRASASGLTGAAGWTNSTVCIGWNECSACLSEGNLLVRSIRIGFP